MSGRHNRLAIAELDRRSRFPVSRARIERNLLKVLKGLAECLDISLGDLVEGIALHAFEGKAPFTPDTLAKIEQLKAVYSLSLTAADAHKLEEKP
jgi:hypothetical protein